MAIIKCKMCGGTLNLIDGASTAKCEYCDTVQTIPTLDDEKKLIQFERAERLRKQCEFDKAAGIYENIVSEFHQEAEAYWGLVLCKYGIEYVDDPATGKKIPTCHRSSFDSVMDDSDFEQAYENADPMARRIYREEAKAIEEIRKGIIAVSANEEPYDIFICYKETDESGSRTLDSVLAQDIYDVLTDKGYRIFFARITLEDKLGQEYEPYIFAALNTAKIMLAVGTDYEYFNAVWVKNEWSRFLKLMAADKSKHLIPCYKGIDAYDMPKEFVRLQAQDLGKVGAIQDLLRGIGKILVPQVSTVAVEQKPTTNSSAMVMRGQFALDDGDWAKADEYFERALDENPQDAKAYVGKVLVGLRLSNVEQINDRLVKLDGDKNFERAIRFSTGADKVQLESIKEWALKKWHVKCLIAGLKEAERKRVEEDRIARERAAQIKKLAAVREKLQCAQNRLSASWLHTVGLKSDGTVVATKFLGKNHDYSGQCDVSEWEDIVAISAGIHHTVGLKADGTVVATKYVGKEYDGQCDVSHWQNIVAISADNWHTVGLKADGTVVAVGSNNHEQCAVSDWKDIVAISAGLDHTVGLKADGTVVAVGSNNHEQCAVSDWKDIVAISAGHNYTIGLKADGTLVATKHSGHIGHIGRDRSDRISEWKDIVAISSGESHVVGLKADGTVVTEVESFLDKCNVDDWKDIVAISAGLDHTVGLKADGTVVATEFLGFDYVGQCDVTDWRLFQSIDTLAEEKETAPKKRKEMLARKKQEEEARKRAEEERIARKKREEEERIAQIEKRVSLRKKLQSVQNRLSSGYCYTVGLKIDGTVVATDLTRVQRYEKPIYIGNCDISEWKNIVAISASDTHTVGLKSDGTVVFIKFFSSSTFYYFEKSHNLYEESEWKDIVAIGAGNHYTVGLKADGTVVAVDNNGKGQLDVSEWRDIVAISVGFSHTVGLKADGTVVAISRASNPEYYEGECEVSEWKDIVAISAGNRYTVGLKSDGTVVAVGSNRKGQCNVSEWKDIVAISAGFDYTVGLKMDGTVVAVGNNDKGQHDVSEWRDIVAICADINHTVGLKSDGTVVQTKFNDPRLSDMNDWRLFQSIDTLEEEKAAALKNQNGKAHVRKKWEEDIAIAVKKQEEEKALALKRQQEEKALALQREQEEQTRQGRRSARLCQHCGGTFSGFFSKKCSRCGKAKDY